MYSIKVKLTTDLTKYHPKLVVGVEGITTGQTGMWSRANDNFIGVSFPTIGVFDVLWQSLAIIDTAYLAEHAKRETQEKEDLKTASEVTWLTGPKGGFKYLSYKYRRHDGMTMNTSTGSREKAEELVKLFESYGIQVKREKFEPFVFDDRPTKKRI